MKTIRFSVIAVSLTCLAATSLGAIQVSFNPQTLVFNPGETEKQVTVQLSNIDAGTNVANLGFYFVYDRDHITISNPQWLIATDNVVPPVDRADGLVIMAAAQSNPIQGGGDAVEVVRLTVSVNNVNPGDEYQIGFKTDAAENGLLDSALTMLDAQWGNCTVQISAGPPNPPDVTGWQYDQRQKDPVNITIQLSNDGNVPTEVRLQYREQGAANWQNAAAAGANITINGKTVTVNWDTPCGADEEKTYELRAIVYDRDESTGPWNAPNPLTVDNKAPQVTGVTGFQNTVTVTYSEAVDQATATDTDNYAVEEVAGAQAGGIEVTNAELSAPNRVTLTVNPQLTEDQRYRLTVRNVQDTVGNAMGAQQVEFTAIAKPQLRQVNFIGPSTIEVVFNGPMRANTVETPGQWSVVPARPGGAAIGVTEATLQDDKVTVRLRLASALEQYTNYTVQGPAGATNEAGQTLGEDNTIDFQTPIWHRFTPGIYLAGIPMSIAGRVRDLVGAAVVAVWDPEANGGQGAYTVDTGGGTTINSADARGWWARFDNESLAIINGQPLRGDVEIDLPAGWNIITNPYFDTNVDIANLDGCLPYAWAWEQDQGYRLVAHLPQNALNVAADTVLRPWKGYFIKMAQAGTLKIAVQGASEPTALPVGGKNATLIQVVARAAGMEDAVNVCGVGEKPFRLANPPRMAGSVDVYFVGENGEPLAMDVRAGSLRQRWNMIVETDLPKTRITVSTPDLSQVPDDYSVILIDPATGARTHLRTSAGYVFTSSANGARRKLILEIVPRQQTTVISGVMAQQVNGARVVVTYQLTGPAAVTARVMNIAGRVIRTLVADRAQTAGQHTIGWNMDNDAGSPVPSGTYLIVLQARTQDGQQVKVVRPLAVNR